MNEHEIGRELDGLVPEPPAAPGRAAGATALARRWRRRRTALVAGAAAAVVVAAGLTAVLAAGHPVEQPSSSSSTRSPEPPSDAGALACPAPLADDDPRPVEDDDRPLPDGATAARLCPVYASFGFQAPRDALTTGVRALVRGINDLPTTDGQDACTADGGITFQVVLGYPDGAERRVYGENFGCRYVRGAGEQRIGAEDLWHDYLAALREQRAHTEPPADVAVALSCPGASYPYRSSPMARTTEATNARLCWRRTDHDGAGGWSGRPLTSDQLDTLLADLRDPARDHQPTEEECRAVELQFSLVTVDAWGDVGHTSGDCGSFYVDDRTPRGLSPAAQRLVDELVTG